MAEYLFRNILEKSGGDAHKRIEVSSAGIILDEEKAGLIKKGIDLPDPLFGYRPLACVMLYLMKRGIDSSTHRSRELSDQIMGNADLVISVVDKHKDAVIKTYPSKREKVFSLEELSRPFRLPEITGEPPGLMPPDRFCMLECDHWEVTDEAMSMIEERLDEAMNSLLGLLGLDKIHL
jgi:protein-tyrosine-phosphatase